jgi:hypothetical protein
MLGQLTNLIYCYYYLADPQAMQSLLDMNRKATPIQALEDPQFRRRLEEANLGTGYLDQGWTVTAIELAEANRRVIVRKGRLSDGEALAKYKEQVQVEQTIDFLKSPIQVRPM